MDDNKRENDIKIDYVVYESSLARMERINKRLFALCIGVFVALMVSNIGWLWYESRFEDTTTITQDVDSQNSPAYVNGTGEMTVNGKSTPDNNKNS